VARVSQQAGFIEEFIGNFMVFTTPSTKIMARDLASGVSVISSLWSSGGPGSVSSYKLGLVYPNFMHLARETLINLAHQACPMHA